MFRSIKTALVVSALVTAYGVVRSPDGSKQLAEAEAAAGLARIKAAISGVCPALKTGDADSTALWSSVAGAAQTHRIDSALVLAVMAVESGCNLKARSKRGALGLMQIMPSTAKWLGVKDPSHPDENIAGGAKYLSMMVDRFGGNIQLAVAAYNAGPAAVMKSGNAIPQNKETQEYVRRVLLVYRELQRDPALQLKNI